MEKISIEKLSTESVTIKKETFDVNGNTVGLPVYASFLNSIRGRDELIRNIESPYKDVILMLWGNSPTVIENTEI